MAFDQDLAAKIWNLLADQPQVRSQKMFGGFAIMVNGHMCCGVLKDALILRIGPVLYPELLKKKYVRPFDFTGKPLTGMVCVSPEGLKTTAALKKWVSVALGFVESLPPKPLIKKKRKDHG